MKGTAGISSFGTKAVGTVGLCALLFAPLGHASIEMKVKGNVDPVEIQALVTDDTGEPIKGLTPEAFTIEENGEVRSIVDFTAPANDSNSDQVSLSVVFVMDYSGSVLSREAEVEKLESAVVKFIGEMNTGDRVAILKFNGPEAGPDGLKDMFDGFAQVDPADTTALIEAAEEDLGFHTGSLVWDSVAYGLDLLNDASLPAGPKALILLSDGKDEGSQVRFDELVDRVERESASVFAVGFGNAQTERLSNLAQAGGTDYVGSQDTRAFETLYLQIAALLQNIYKLSYASGFAMDDCTQLSLRLTVNSGLSDEQAAQLAFSRCGILNYAPTIESEQAKTYVKGMAVSLQITAADRENDPLTFSATGLPPGLTINPDDGNISGTPTEVGVYDVQVTVTDGHSAPRIAFTAEVVEPVATTSSSGGGGGLGSLSLLLLGCLMIGSRVLLVRRT